jgi:hypothetical protein
LGRPEGTRKMTAVSELRRERAVGSRGEEVAIEEISRRRLQNLSLILRSSRSADAYVRSPLYFAFTGRKGLLYLRLKSAEFIACIHPNDIATLLLFIPFVYDAPSFRSCLKTLTHNLKAGPKSSLFGLFALFDNVQIARVPKNLIDAGGLSDSSIERGCRLQREDKLDWTYPSYDVSLSRSVHPSGAQFAAYRNKLNKYSNRDVTAVPFTDVPGDERAAAILAISERWAENKVTEEWSRSKLDFSIDDLVEPYEYLSELALNPLFSVNGIFLKKSSKYIAFRLWEDNGNHGDAVASFAALSALHEPGCCEYLYYWAARRLLELGYKEMCIGGSESEGLDSFKQKFCPIRAHELYTVSLDIYRIADFSSQAQAHP